MARVAARTAGLLLTTGLGAIVTILLVRYVQWRQVNLQDSDAHRHRDTGGDSLCPRKVYEVGKTLLDASKSDAILSETQIMSLAKRTPLPQQVSSLQFLFQAPWGAIVVWDSTKDLILNSNFLSQPASFTVGVVVTAIGKYIQFLEDFLLSADKYFLAGERLTYIIFTDHVDEVQDMKLDHPKIIFEEENMGWPYNALMLYGFINKHSEALMKFDFLYVFDVDIVFESEVGREILGMRVGTIHPGFFTKPRTMFTYDENPKSTAFVNKTVEGVYYFAGALFGGCSDEVTNMASIINKNVHKDLEIGYIAVWHDESHLNR